MMGKEQAILKIMPGTLLGNIPVDFNFKEYRTQPEKPGHLHKRIQEPGLVKFWKPPMILLPRLYLNLNGIKLKKS